MLKIMSTKEDPLYICGETVHTHFKCTTTMWEAFIHLVHQYLALWDKQDAKYKDSNYKDAKWKKIDEILCLTKEDVIKKWKSLRDTLMRQKSTKSKSGNGLSDSRLKWKYYNIMSFLHITLLKLGYVPIYLKTPLTTSLTYIQHTYIQQLCMNWSDQFGKNHIKS